MKMQCIMLFIILASWGAILSATEHVVTIGRQTKEATAAKQLRDAEIREQIALLKVYDQLERSREYQAIREEKIYAKAGYVRMSFEMRFGIEGLPNVEREGRHGRVRDVYRVR